MVRTKEILQTCLIYLPVHDCHLLDRALTLPNFVQRRGGNDSALSLTPRLCAQDYWEGCRTPGDDDHTP